jgi:hypothetical protein
LSSAGASKACGRILFLGSEAKARGYYRANLSKYAKKLISVYAELSDLRSRRADRLDERSRWLDCRLAQSEKHPGQDLPSMSGVDRRDLVCGRAPSPFGIGEGGSACAVLDEDRRWRKFLGKKEPQFLVVQEAQVGIEKSGAGALRVESCIMLERVTRDSGSPGKLTQEPKPFQLLNRRG